MDKPRATSHKKGNYGQNRFSSKNMQRSVMVVEKGMHKLSKDHDFFLLLRCRSVVWWTTLATKQELHQTNTNYHFCLAHCHHQINKKIHDYKKTNHNVHKRPSAGTRECYKTRCVSNLDLCTHDEALMDEALVVDPRQQWTRSKNWGSKMVF